MTFDPLRNFLVSHKRFGRFRTLKYLATSHKNNLKRNKCLEVFIFKGASFLNRRLVIWFEIV